LKTKRFIQTFQIFQNCFFHDFFFAQFFAAIILTVVKMALNDSAQNGFCKKIQKNAQNVFFLIQKNV